MRPRDGPRPRVRLNEYGSPSPREDDTRDLLESLDRLRHTIDQLDVHVQDLQWPIWQWGWWPRVGSQAPTAVLLVRPIQDKSSRTPKCSLKMR